jgi:hypothetical protein
MQTFRSRNYGIFMTVPDKESITLSTRRLVNCYIDVNKRDNTHAFVDIRWLSRARGTEKTQTYYKYPVFKDPISGKLKKIVKYKIPKLASDVETEYNKIKNNTIQDMYDYYQKELEFMEKENKSDYKEYSTPGRWDYDPNELTYWGCRLFWSKELAKKSFG